MPKRNELFGTVREKYFITDIQHRSNKEDYAGWNFIKGEDPIFDWIWNPELWDQVHVKSKYLNLAEFNQEYKEKMIKDLFETDYMRLGF